MKTSKNNKKELVIKAMKPFEIAVIVLLVIWAIAGTILTAVAVVAGGFATFFVGGAAGWVVGLLGVLLFWVAPWFALKAVAKLEGSFITWLRRDRKKEARVAEFRAVAGATLSKRLAHGRGRI